MSCIEQGNWASVLAVMVAARGHSGPENRVLGSGGKRVWRSVDAWERGRDALMLSDLSRVRAWCVYVGSGVGPGRLEEVAFAVALCDLVVGEGSNDRSTIGQR